MKHLCLISSVISKKLAANIIISLMLSYFVLHSIYGSRGIIAYFKLNQQLAKADIELENLRAERVIIAHRVKMLRPESLDKDLLDEQTRHILGVASVKEQVFATNTNQNN